MSSKIYNHTFKFKIHRRGFQHTVYHLLEYFTAEEINIEYKCELCNQNYNNNTKRLLLQVLPKILIITIKRFESNLKINDGVTILDKLNMKDFSFCKLFFFLQIIFI